MAVKSGYGALIKQNVIKQIILSIICTRRNEIHSMFFTMNRDYTHLALGNSIYFNIYFIWLPWLVLLLCHYSHYSWCYLFVPYIPISWKHVQNVQEIELIYFPWLKNMSGAVDSDYDNLECFHQTCINK